MVFPTFKTCWKVGQGLLSSGVVFLTYSVLTDYMAFEISYFWPSGFADFSNETGASSQPPPPEMGFFKELMKEDPQLMGQFEQLAQ